VNRFHSEEALHTNMITVSAVIYLTNSMVQATS